MGRHRRQSIEHFALASIGRWLGHRCCSPPPAPIGSTQDGPRFATTSAVAGFLCRATRFRFQVGRSKDKADLAGNTGLTALHPDVIGVGHAPPEVRLTQTTSPVLPASNNVPDVSPTRTRSRRP